jgi:hypothetical protein
MTMSEGNQVLRKWSGIYTDAITKRPVVVEHALLRYFYGAGIVAAARFLSATASVMRETN